VKGLVTGWTTGIQLAAGEDVSTEQWVFSASVTWSWPLISV